MSFILYLKYIINNLKYSIILIIVSYLIYQNFVNNENDGNYSIILWWTAFIPTESSKIINCGENNCFITQNRSLQQLAKALMFYGTDFNKLDLPLPRNGSSKIWALLHEESLKNNPILAFEESLRLFNISSTFSRFSDFPITLQYLPSIEDILDTKYYIPVEKKNTYLEEIAPVLYLQSTCDNPIGRDDIVSELMKYIKIDSYGQCLRNKPPANTSDTDYLNNFYSVENLEFISKYKFYIAIENSECDDYITEKLWRPLIAGVIPIYKGSPTVEKWLPNNDSLILVDNFSNLKHLAAFIDKVNRNNTLYNKFLQHKLGKTVTEKISNNLLLETVKQRSWTVDSVDSMNVDNDEKSHFINQFQCFVCNFINDEDNFQKEFKVTLDHYKCKMPNSNSWKFVWQLAKCDALALNYLVMTQNSINYTEDEFNLEVQKMMKLKLC